MASNFEFLAKYWPDMAQIGKMAELYLYADANACIYKIGVLAERVAQEICVFEKIDLPDQTTHVDRIRALKYADLLPKRIDDMFYTLRKARNDAVHMGLDSYERAGALLHLAFNLCCWLMEVYGDWTFNAPEYQTPEDTTQNADFVNLLQAQEDKINALMAAVEEIRTAASDTAKDDRAEKATQAAKELPLTAEETDCIGDEPIRMDVAVLPVINYAMQQNGAVAIQSITIENTTDAVIEDVDIEITATPAFALPFTRHIDHLPANKTVTISRPKLILNGEYLAGMTEKVTGVLHIELKTEEKVLVSDNAETTVFAFDEWHGVGLYPELLATFVTPNHPELARIIARATEFLGQWTGDTSMDGYQSQDPNRVLSQAAAIFTAIKEQAIAYVVPPASFERVGQRVRLCDMVLQQKLGTCLDLTLLYASCLEAVGLHPLLITTVGHIFTGVWLEERMFPECVQDDFSLITKRLASGVNEIAVVETTAVTTGKDLSFDHARAIGEQNLTTQQVEYIIDVYRARMSRISPLPQRVHTAAGWEIKHDASFKEENMSAPTQLDETIVIDPNIQDDNLPKKVQWERKLLDLGMRNTLINLRMTKTQLPILTNSLDELENALADGSDFTILPKPADWRLEEFSFEALNEMGAAGIIKAEFENKRLRSVFTEGELSKAIKGLYRTAKAALEENGANTLYLALGMLRWFESKRSTKARYAPIILVPIEMVRKSAAQGYVIRLRDDEPQMNITLLEKLKQDFGIVVKGLDPLPGDEHGIDIRRVLTIMRKAVMEQSHWDVLETASIGIFSFSQFVMWNDIRNRTDDLMRNKVVRSLIEGKLSWDAQPLEIGQRVNENNVLLPMPADASQLYATCKAVGVLARGKDAIIVGDPKQMPPTSFFAANTVDEDNLEAEDLESILDDCLALNMPQSHLLWHYRSRHESLIAFSNSQFYENKLFTFPSVNDRESKVRLVHVDGIFDRGKTRTNKAEAQAVIEEIKRRCKDPELSKQSLGIVTFNISQQHLIDDLLTEACTQDPELEKWAFNEDEPLFIKNLENVQGDERDVILFSIGFGPDENGKLYMNFGPLNRDGGWRRLNVAVSRARCEMMVFSNMRPDQLDLNRTKAEGVAALRSFLEYAEGRTLALEEATVQMQREGCDGIAAAICKALEEKGYETDLSVGRSEYRIDIGVVDPKNPDQYVLGIMLDGSTYGAAKTTRDREIAQISILSGLGWRILRVWCMDWWDNREKELKRIFDKLQDIQNGVQEPETETPAAPQEPVKLQENAAIQMPADVQPAPIKSAPVYKAATVPVKFLSADAFIEPWNERDIQSKIKLVINAEAPVSLSMLTKRVVQSYGIARAGSRIQGHLNAILRKMNPQATTQEDTVFFWKKEQNPDAYIGFRASGDGDNRRDVRDVPVQEVANAIYTVLYEQISMGQEDLLRETANKLGYTRLGNNVLSALALGIQYAQVQGGITTGTNGTFVLSNGGTARAEATLQSF